MDTEPRDYRDHSWLNEPDADEYDRRETAADTGAELFDAAELLAVLTDRRRRDWHNEALADLVRARDAARAAFVLTLLLVGPGNSTAARRMAARAVGPGFDFLSAELRAGHPVSQGALLAAWETMAHDA